jgi:putative ABC transport system permease protein
LGNLFRDIHYGLRSFTRSPIPSLAAVLTLALCIGANTTIFTLINSFYQGLPVVRPERLVSVYTSSPVFGAYGRTSYQDYVDYRDRNTVFEGLAADASFGASLSVGDDTEWVWGGLVSGNYFAVLGVEAAVGRTFAPDERKPGGPRVVVLSHDLWARRFQGDPGVIGRVVKLNQQDFTIIGVAPERFKGTMAFFHPALWIPIHHLAVAMEASRLEERPDRWVALTGRLRSGIPLAQAQSNFDVLAAALEKEHPEDKGNERKVTLWESTWMPPAAREWYLPSVKLLLWAVLVLLLIACVNVSNLLLARTNARRIETGVQLALGAKRLRLARQVFIDSFLLALVGGILGLPLAMAASRFVAGYFGPATPGAQGSAPVMEADLRVYSLTFAACLLTTLLAGLVPALRLFRGGYSMALRERRSEEKPGPFRLTWGGSLVVLQIALSFALLLSATLLASGLRKVLTTDPGYPIRNVLLAQVDVLPAGYDPAKGRRFYHELLDEVGATAGVSGVSVAEVAPLSGFSRSETVRFPEAPDQEITVDANVVGPSYFETLGIPLLRGRGLTFQDTTAAPGVLVVNESFVKQFLQKGEPLGRRLSLGSVAEGEPGPDFEIVGLARDTRYLSLGEDPRPLIYISVLQRYRPRMTLVLRTAGDPRGEMSLTRQKIKAIDTRVPVIFLATLEQHLNSSIWEQRLRAQVLQAFGLLALGLAAVGIFGLMTYNVTKRWHEIGVRMALGANRRDIVFMVFKDTLRLAAVGIVLGIPASLWARKLLSSFLVGLGESGTRMSLTFLGVALLLTGTALLAGWLPARRASRLDSLIAIKTG